MCRHYIRKSLPSREIAFIRIWHFSWRYYRTISDTIFCKYISIQNIRQLVNVDLVLCGVDHIMRRYGLIDVPPANKGISFLRWSLWSDYWSTIFHLSLRNDHSVSNECYLVLVRNV